MASTLYTCSMCGGGIRVVEGGPVPDPMVCDQPRCQTRYAEVQRANRPDDYELHETIVIEPEHRGRK